MKKMSETIVFFGSGPVAAASLKLLAADFEIEAVITKPQPAHHKLPFPVLSIAGELDIPILTASNKEELSGLIARSNLKSRLGVIIDHGIIVEQSVIDYFPLGIVNSHFSLLPRLRGPDPISFAILNGDRETGVSLMIIVDKLDEGPLIDQKALGISPDSDSLALTDQLIDLSHRMLRDTLPKYVKGEVKPYPQLGFGPTYTHKLTKEDGQLDFTKPAIELERQVRAFAGWPRSRARIGDTPVIVTGARAIDGGGAPGAIWIENKQLGIHAGEGILIIEKMIPSGRKEMTAEAFLAGYKLG